MTKLFLIEVDNGEDWEDNRSWIEKVYKVSTKKNLQTVEAEWKEFIVKYLKEINIFVNEVWTTAITIDSPRRDSDVTRKEVKSVHTEFSFDKWIVANYGAKEMKFETIHIY